MSTPLCMVASGSYISDGAARTINFPTRIDHFLIRNRSTWGTNPNAVVESTWYRGYAAGQSTSILETGAGVLNSAITAAGGLGFTEVDESLLTDGAAVANITGITNATPAVAATVTPATVGQIVRVYNTTGMLQIAGLEFEVTAVVAGVSMTFGYLPAAGFAAAATAGTFRVLPNKRYLPTRRWITAITAANPAVITTSVAHGYNVGDRITVHVPAQFGMVEMEGLTGIVTAVTASTITTDINSAAFTAFAYPTSAIAAAGVSFPHVVPFGEVATSLLSPTDNQTVFGLFLDTAVVGANTNVMDWYAFAREYTA